MAMNWLGATTSEGAQSRTAAPPNEKDVALVWFGLLISVFFIHCQES